MKATHRESVSIPFKREGVSELKLGHQERSEWENPVSIPFKREGVSEPVRLYEPATRWLRVSIPFHRAGVSERQAITTNAA